MATEHLTFDPRQLGSVLRAMRMARKLSIKALAIDVGCTPQNISNIESGRNMPSLPTLIAICDVLEVPIDSVLSCVRRRPLHPKRRLHPLRKAAGDLP